MKNKILIVLLSIICISLTGIVIYQNKNYIKIPKQYKCVGIPQKGEQISSKQIIVVNINTEQYVESYQNKNIRTYEVKEQYEKFKNDPKLSDVNYLYDDKSLSVVMEYTTDVLKDEDGNSATIWYKDYINNLEDLDYKCTILK